MLKRCPIFVLRNNVSRFLNNSSSKFSTIPAAKQTTDSTFQKRVEDLEGLGTVFQKKRVKLPQKPPFVKNLFLGKFDTDILTYPQLQKEDVDQLETLISVLQKVSYQQDEPKNIREVLQRLKQQRCLGLQCHVDIGGRELNHSEHCRYNEILLDSKFKLNIVNNELSILALTKFGSDKQKSKYLQKLLEGSIVSTVCIGENSGLGRDKSSEVKATHLQDTETYLLNGKKLRVVGANESDLYIVFTHMGDSVKDSIHEFDLTAVLVDSTLPGIKIEKIETKDPNLFGTSNISFNDTPILSQNILGIERDGRHTLSYILEEYYIMSGVMSMNIIKRLSKYVAQDVLRKSAPGEETYNTEAITSKLGELVMNAYMVESVTYLTSGLKSMYDNQDCEIESLITKILSAELALKSCEIGYSLSGAASIEARHYCQELHQEALTQFTLCEHENMMRILIALLGLQYSGKSVGDTVKKLRNPMFNASFIWKKLWKDRYLHDDRPKLTIGLKNYLHLSCQDAANELEYCVLRLQFITESLFAANGINILNRHCHLRRLANAVIQIYVMTACLGRASRSYCIGLQYADNEILMAHIICKRSLDIVKKNFHEILSEYENADKSFSYLTENVYKDKDYYFVHPLTRNF